MDGLLGLVVVALLVAALVCLGSFVRWLIAVARGTRGGIVETRRPTAEEREAKHKLSRLRALQVKALALLPVVMQADGQ
jgi:hypothetical protein